MEHVNLNFRINQAFDSAIRITFDRNSGAWSLLGTDAARSRRSNATMNLGFNQGGTYLHEFGHAMGAIHEHQNPEGGIKWNRQAVIRDLSGPPNNWDLATIERNMFKRYSMDQTNGTAVDTKSIMLYAIPSRWTLDGFSSKPNSRLSEGDKSFAAKAYPKATAKTPGYQILDVVDASPTTASLRTLGERDLYKIRMTGGHHVIETFGDLDIVMQLFSDTDLVASDDNSGLNKNARIEGDFDSGIYVLQVSHNGTAVGQYDVRVLKGPAVALPPAAQKDEEVLGVVVETTQGKIRLER